MPALTKSELIARIFERYPCLTERDAEVAVNEILRTTIGALSHGVRVEVRGFGSFSVKRRGARLGRNPRTGEPVNVPAKFVPIFRAGKEVRKQMNDSFQSESEK